jgi:hypothetical protein
MSRHPIYTAALDADAHFQRALVKEYGSRAGDMRYLTREQTPAIQELGQAKARSPGWPFPRPRAGRSVNWRGKWG